MLYFDHNATTPLSPEAKGAWLQAAEQFPGNPSSPHRVGQRADAALNEARGRLAEILGCEAHEIVWTSGATEASNLVLHHAACTLASDAEVWVSAIEHPCVLAPAKFHFPRRLRLIPAGRDGVTELAWLERELRSRRPGLIAVMAANNETGVLQPWRQAANLCRQAGVPYYCDAAQWLGKLPSDELGAPTFVSGCAHKFGGPKGVGFLKCPANTQPQLLGGSQEEGRRGGTENVPGVLALVAALEARTTRLRNGEHTAREQWRKKFEAALLASLAGAGIVGAPAPRLWNTVSALMPEADCQQRWVVKLDRLGFAVSTGSACASGKEEPSPVLLAMGVDAADAGRVLRFSSGWETAPADWDDLLAALNKVGAQIKLGSVT